MNLPDYLLEEVRNGRVVLFLGAGASRGAENNKGEEPPSAEELTRILSDKFLGGKHKNQPLSWVSELAISESSLAEVQNFIRGIFLEFKPADFHLRLPTFRWRGIATTNYDMIVEQAYQLQKNPIQRLVRFLSDKNRVDDSLRSKESLPLLKLHGCISHTEDPNLPLILTPEQYSTYREGRSRLFDTFEDWGYEYPIVFIGHGLHDSDIRHFLLRLAKYESYRPRYYLVKPSVPDEEARLWESKRIAVLPGSFRDFLEALDKGIPANTRPILTQVGYKHSIETRFTLNEKADKTLLDFLENEADYVHQNVPISDGSAREFYKGMDLEWYPIERKLDVRRNLIDEVLFDTILAAEGDRPTKTELYVIKAEAGAGKSVLLRRLAWDAAVDGNVFCIFVRKYGQIRYEPFYELHRLTRERIFVFIDNAADNVAELEQLVTKARNDKLLLTIITAERTNEWNMGCERLEPYVTGTYQLPYLSRKEIENLVDLLEKHGSLGHLEGLSKEEKIEAFEQRAGRQILVALHEATLGKPFEEILVDEYNEIRPQPAKSLYLSVCVLNRLNVLVRAGLISRVHGIPFTHFDDKLFKPLEHVVQVSRKPATGDYYYSARHPQIAEIVFDRILIDPDDRFGEYAGLLSSMNISYSTDRSAYRGLIRGRTLLNLFPDSKAVAEIFRIAYKIAQDDPYLFHQQGIYEMNRPNGDLEQAHRYLQKAREMNEHGPVIHSLAELARLRADRSTSQFEKERYRSEARKLSNSLLNDEISRRYARHTLIKLSLDRLKEVLEPAEPSDREIDDLAQEIERHIERGLQEHPGDPYILTAESDFREILLDKERALGALADAFDVNKRNSFIAGRLAKSYQSQGKTEEAVKVIEQALEANPDEKRLHYHLAMLLRRQSSVNMDNLIYHLRRSFSKGDQNYDAQFWYARYCFASNSEELIEEGKQIFRDLRDAPIPHDVRHEIRSKVEEGNAPKSFTGTLTRKEVTYGFIERDGRGDRVFTHRNDLDAEIWRLLQENDRVNFEIGFNFGGPIALNVEPWLNEV